MVIKRRPMPDSKYGTIETAIVFGNGGPGNAKYFGPKSQDAALEFFRACMGRGSTRSEAQKQALEKARAARMANLRAEKAKKAGLRIEEGE